MRKLSIALFATLLISQFASAGVCERELRDCKQEAAYTKRNSACFDFYTFKDCRQTLRANKKKDIKACKTTYLACEEDHEYTPPQRQFEG